MTYLDKLTRSVQESRSLLCVGLDPNPVRIPSPLKTGRSDRCEQVLRFCLDVIDATSEHCAAFKPNLAFFESLGADGFSVLHQVVEQIPAGKVIIADAKRGDIGSTAHHYKMALFDRLGADAVTLNPLMGFDTMDPFMEDASRAVYALVLTTNPGARDLLTRPFEGEKSLATYIAGRLHEKASESRTHLGMVVGATWPDELLPVLDACPNASLLIPGVGAQGGSIQDLIPVLKNHPGIPLISASRSVIYAGGDRREWKSEVARSARELSRELLPLGERFFA